MPKLSNAGTEDVAAQWLESRNSKFQTAEDPGFDPLAVQGEGQFLCPSPRVNSCAKVGL